MDDDSTLVDLSRIKSNCGMKRIRRSRPAFVSKRRFHISEMQDVKIRQLADGFDKSG